MVTLYFIRHAQSEANSKRIMASRLPFPLTKAGREDAALIASQLAERVNITRIISSPLVRAVQTARCFALEYTLPIEEDERLAEQHLGDYSGMGYDQVKLEKDYEQITSRRWDWIPKGGGESYKMIAERVESFLGDIKTDREDNILIVSHAVTFRLIRAVLEGTLPQYPEAFPNNGEIWKVPYRGPGHSHVIESVLLGNSRSFVHNP